MSNNYKFSLDNFKRWMDDHHDEEGKIEKPTNGLLGLQVESKVASRKLAHKMSVESGEAEQLAIEFEQNGGKVIGIEGKTFLIETASGSFTIHRYYVQRA